MIPIFGKDKPYIGLEDEFQKATARIVAYKKVLAFHTPNGGKRNPKEGAKFKRMGVRAGVSDWIFLEPMGSFHGLIIELKVESRKGRLGSLSSTQKTFLLAAQSRGFYVCVVYNIDSFLSILKGYFEKD